VQVGDGASRRDVRHGPMSGGRRHRPPLVEGRGIVSPRVLSPSGKGSMSERTLRAGNRGQSHEGQIHAGPGAPASAPPCTLCPSRRRPIHPPRSASGPPDCGGGTRGEGGATARGLGSSPARRTPRRSGLPPPGIPHRTPPPRDLSRTATRSVHPLRLMGRHGAPDGERGKTGQRAIGEQTGLGRPGQRGVGHRGHDWNRPAPGLARPDRALGPLSQREGPPRSDCGQHGVHAGQMDCGDAGGEWRKRQGAVAPATVDHDTPRLLPVGRDVGTTSTTARPGHRLHGFAPSDRGAHGPEEGARRAIARRRGLPVPLTSDPVAALTHDGHRRGAMGPCALIRSSPPAAEGGRRSPRGRGQGGAPLGCGTIGTEEVHDGQGAQRGGVHHQPLLEVDPGRRVAVAARPAPAPRRRHRGRRGGDGTGG
jgi:hypothetical protein